MEFNDSYLNKTRNKDPRNSSPISTGRVEFIVWHGTDSPNPANTPATLDWAMTNDGKRGAANYYIAQSGELYHYIDESKFIAYHAGAGGAKARGYTGYQVNVHSIGIEVEERITKKPQIAATPASLFTAAQLALYLKQTWAIPLERAYHVGHKEIVNPGYRSDPHSYSIDNILAQAKVMEVVVPISSGVDPRFMLAWQTSGGIWQRNELTPGYPIAPAFDHDGKTYQLFERGCARLDPENLVSWLLISEVIALKQSTGK